MAIFRIENVSNNKNADVELVFNPNPIGSNTWRVVGGDPTTLSVAHGLWNSDGLQNRLMLRDDSNIQIAYLEINVAVSLTDPFSSVNVGNSGSGGLLPVGALGWTMVSK